MTHAEEEPDPVKGPARNHDSSGVGFDFSRRHTRRARPVIDSRRSTDMCPHWNEIPPEEAEAHGRSGVVA